MSQRLILPITAMKMTASYQNAKYLALFGFAHYGIDAVSTVGNTSVYALGNGTVIAAGMDGSTLTGPTSQRGNCIVIVYKNVMCNDGRIRDLSCRMFHFDSIAVKKGDSVTSDTVIGRYGNTGANTTGAHLHIELDSDIEWAQYAVGIKSSGNIIKKGTVNSTVNPSKVWFIGKGQSITGYGSGYTDASDVDIPAFDNGTGSDSSQLAADFDELAGLYDVLLKNHNALEADFDGLAKLYDKLLAESKQMRQDIAALADKWPG